MKNVIAVTLCMSLTACAAAEPGSIAAIRRIVGTDLIGARGATQADQIKIDRTIVGICAPQIYTKAECAAHGQAIRSGDQIGIGSTPREGNSPRREYQLSKKSDPFP